jgi:hypothetical protein
VRYRLQISSRLPVTYQLPLVRDSALRSGRFSEEKLMEGLLY